jgi:hypothetical protein
MAKKLTKALRGKRRWFGVAVAPEMTTRSQLQTTVNNLQKFLGSKKEIKLMDFYYGGSEAAELAHTNLNETLPKVSLNGDEGLAIIQVPHEISNEFRELIETEQGYAEYSMLSVSMSGKIRLIRERLNLPKPSRERR